MIYLHLRGSVVSHIITLVFISHGSNLQYRKHRYASDLYMMKNKINTFVVLNLPLCCFKTKKISIYQLPFYHSSLKSILWCMLVFYWPHLLSYYRDEMRPRLNEDFEAPRCPLIILQNTMKVLLNSTMITGSKTLQMVGDNQCCVSRIQNTTIQKTALGLQSWEVNRDEGRALIPTFKVP